MHHGVTSDPHSCKMVKSNLYMIDFHFSDIKMVLKINSSILAGVVKKYIMPCFVTLYITFSTLSNYKRPKLLSRLYKNYLLYLTS